MTIYCGHEPSNHSCTYAISTIINVNPMLVKVREMGFRFLPKAKAPLKVVGRLASFVDTWKVLTRDTWVLDAIQGYKIPLLRTPHQSHKPQEGVFSQHHTALMQKEAESLLKKEQSPLAPTAIPSPQEEWSDAASDQSETIEQLGGNPTFQNGGYSDSQRPAKNRQLDGEDRLEGCLLHNSHSQSSPAVPQILGSRSLLPIHLPPI